MLKRLPLNIKITAFFSLVIVLSPLTTIAFQTEEKYDSGKNQVFTLQDSQEIFYKTEINKKIGLDLRNVSLKHALKEIAKQTGFKLTYRGDIMNNNRVTLIVEDISVSDALSSVLEGTGLEYLVSKEGYLLVRQEKKVENIEISNQETVTGRVTDADSQEPLPGVNIIVKGTTIGTSTNMDGIYELNNVPTLQDTLIFSFIGYRTEEIPIDGRSNIDIELQIIGVIGTDVVVTGYITQDAENVTSAIGTANMDVVRSRAETNTGNLLQGTVAGLNVTASNGNPGDDAILTVRGFSTFFGNNDPLVIVDGIEVETGINNINPNDIESVSVLKDAASAAIYGSRAANGVIVIETKKGGGAPIVEYDMYVGLQQPRNNIEVTDAEGWVTVLQRMHGDEFFTNPLIPQAAVQFAENPNNFQNFDWVNLVYNSEPITNHNLAVSGGGDVGRYRVSGGYIEQQGTTLGTSFNRTNFRAGGDFNLGANDNIVIGGSASGFRSLRRPEPDAFSRSVLQQAIKIKPVFSPRTPDGEFRTTDFFFGGGDNPEKLIRNPFLFNELEDEKITQTEINLNMFIEVKELFDMFKYKLNGTFSNLNNDFFRQFKDKGENQGEFFDPNKSISETKTQIQNWSVNQTLTFEKDFGRRHSTDITGLFVTQKFDSETISGFKSFFLSDQTNTLGAPGGQNANLSGSRSFSTLVSLGGQFFYSFDDRYILNGTFRRDGSSRFNDDLRWGNFGGLSGGWRITNEKFWLKNEIISDLLIRGSYGQIGRQNIGDFDVVPTLNSVPVVFGDNINEGLNVNPPINTQAKWEKLVNRTFGIDFELLNGSLSGSFDYYKDVTKDLIIGIPNALSIGGGIVERNDGRISNTGVEVELNYNSDASKAFQFNAGFTLGTQDVVVEEIGQDKIIFGAAAPEWDVAHVMEFREGGTPADFWVIKTDGIFKSQEEVDNHSQNGVPIQPDAQVGDVKFIDANGDGRITDDDRQLAGSGIPKVNIGFNFSANYKNLDMFINATGAFGQVIYNANEFLIQKNSDFGNFSPALLDAFDPVTNPDSNIPRLNPNDINENNNSRPQSDRFIEDGDYVKIRNLEFGYTFPVKFINSIDIRNARVFFRAQNLATFTSYSGLDPEVGSSPFIQSVGFQTPPSSAGLDRDTAPQARQFHIGLSLRF